MRLSLVVAVADNGVIGAKGKIPWHLPADSKRFKALTWGKPVIMGRKTFESLPRALPGRQNIVITHNRNYSVKGARIAADFESALRTAAGVDEVMIVGGVDIFARAMDEADRIYLTEVHTHPDGDVYFPAFDRRQWHEALREDHPSETGRPAFSFVNLERVSEC